jgi:hypothetical protein
MLSVALSISPDLSARIAAGSPPERNTEHVELRGIGELGDGEVGRCRDAAEAVGQLAAACARAALTNSSSDLYGLSARTANTYSRREELAQRLKALGLVGERGNDVAAGW